MTIVRLGAYVVSSSPAARQFFFIIFSADPQRLFLLLYILVSVPTLWTPGNCLGWGPSDRTGLAGTEYHQPKAENSVNVCKLAASETVVVVVVVVFVVAVVPAVVVVVSVAVGVIIVVVVNSIS